MKVRNMISLKGNKIPNQFVITDGETTVFQSYETVIVKRIGRSVYLDQHAWNYSRTTSRYRNLFLNTTTAETRRKIKDGTYTLCDLNC
jgi:hypothetical protein